MAVKTFAEQLESVQNAIAAIESGNQSYRLETGVGTGRAVTRADLATLYKRESWLRGKASREAAGGGLRIRNGTAQ